MENSRRNILIVVGVVAISCICIAFIGLAVLGFLFPFERVTGLFATDVPVVETFPPTTQVTAEITIEPTATESEIQHSPTIEVSEARPTEEVQASPTADPVPPEIALQMDEIEDQVISLRELQPVGIFSRRLLTREELRKKIEADFFEDYSEEEAGQDTIVLSAIGLLEPGFDLFNFYQELLIEQVAGQYDQTSQEMDIILNSEFGGIERLTYAHEYTHALQDQNYDIVDGLNYSEEACEEDSEACAAVQALLEGDAAMAELEWLNNYATVQDLRDIQAFYEDYEGPVFESAPDFLQEDFIFPYIYGQAFVEYLHNLGGWGAVNSAYSELPVSTEQILHPERYPQDKPIKIDIPDLMPVLGEPWQELDSGEMGEWYSYLILAHGWDPNARLDDTDAQLASEGWGGDFYTAYYDQQNDATVFVLYSVWESDRDSQQFFDAFREHSTDRFGSPASVNGNQVRWNHGEGVTELTIDGEFTTWILAPDEATVAAVHALLP